jgi:hypothetical protein
MLPAHANVSMKWLMFLAEHYLLEDYFDTSEQICDRVSDYSVNFIFLLFLLFVHSFRLTIRTMMS